MTEPSSKPTSMTSGILNPRFDYIDALRGWAIIGVMLTHVGIKTLNGEGITRIARRITDLGAMGVPLFYMVSAFTILYLYEARRRTEIRPVGSFYIRRIMRIAPVYWAGIAVYTLIYGLTGSRGWLDAPMIWHYPFHLFFLNMTNPFTPSTVVPGGWSISNEMIFYALVPALYFVVRTLKGALAFFALMIVASPFFAELAVYLTQSAFTSASPRETAQFVYRWLPNQLVCFASGFVLFHLLKDRDDSRLLVFVRRHRAAIAAGLLSAIPAIAFASMKTPIDKNVFWSAWFLALGIALRVHRWVALLNPLTIWLGKISFSCYVIHFLAIDLLSHLLPEANALVRFVLISALAIPLTSGIAHISFKYFEEPMNSICKKLVRRFQASQPTTYSTEAK